MTALNDILEIIHVQVIDGEEILNRYNYQVILQEAPSEIEVLLDDFKTNVIPLIQAIQTSNVDYVELRGQNLTNGVEIGTVSLSGMSGLRSGGLASNQTAMALRLNRVTKVTKNGAKRYAGLSETDLVTNGLSSGLQTAMGELGDQLLLGLEFESPTNERTEAAFVIVGTLPSGGYDLTRVNGIGSISALNRVSSQNTRKAY